MNKMPITAPPPQEATTSLLIDKSVFLRKFTENALQQAKEGNLEEYNKLVKVFTYSHIATSIDPGKYVEEVTPWLPALSANVSQLNITYRDLVNTIFFSDWITVPQETFVHRYSTLVLQILSAHPAWCSQATNALARWFSFGARAHERSAASVVHDRVHSLLSEIYRTIPTSGTSLATAIVGCRPFKGSKTDLQVVYIQDVLRCIEYAQSIQHEVMAMLLNHVIQIDVEVQVELEDLSDDEEEEEDHEDGVFQFDDEDAKSYIEDSSDSDSESESEDEDEDDLGKVQFSVRKTISKLDAIMSTMFGWLEKHSHLDPDAGEMPQSTSQLFLVFLELFNTLVLPTFKSRYTQFFVFYLCGKDPQYADVFLGTMVGHLGKPMRNVAQQDSVSNHTKVAAASYLGSFVARAKFLSGQIVRNVVGVLVQWANAYLDWQEQLQRESEDASVRPASLLQRQTAGGMGSRSVSMGQRSLPPASTQMDMDKHAVFYAVVQSVLYMFCFRWRDLAESSEGGAVVETELDSLRWCHEVEGLQRIVFSRLNPLRACSSAVAMQFSQVASQTNFMFCYAMIQQNRRSNAKEDPMANPDQILRARLDTFFPFDPMLLPASRQYVDGIYLAWQEVGGGGGGGGGGDEEDDGEEAEEEEDAVVDQMATMSISPVPPLSALPGHVFQK